MLESILTNWAHRSLGSCDLKLVTMTIYVRKSVIRLFMEKVATYGRVGVRDAPYKLGNIQIVIDSTITAFDNTFCDRMCPTQQHNTW